MTDKSCASGCGGPAIEIGRRDTAGVMVKSISQRSRFFDIFHQPERWRFARLLLNSGQARRHRRRVLIAGPGRAVTPVIHGRVSAGP